MKSLFKIITFFFLGITLFSGCKSAKVITKTADQTKDAVKPLNEASLLWKVEGNGIKPSYVFGTVHVLKEKDFDMKEKVKKAIDQVDQLVLEVDMDDPNMQMEMMKHVTMKDGITIKDLVNEAVYKKIDDKLKQAMGVGVQMFDTWQPMMVSTLLLMDIIGEQPASFEASLTEMAQKNELEILGLETMEDQLNFIHNIPYEEQTKMIIAYIDEGESMIAEFEALTKTYLSEDIDALHRLMEKQAQGYDFMDNLVDDRNQNWIPQIKKLASDKASFFGVGAGHLGGSKGVINLLRKAGYKVTAVM